MKRQRDHGLDGGEVHLDAAVVVGHVGRLELAVVGGASVHGQEGVRVLVGGPDGGETGGLGGHDVHAIAVVGVHAGNAGTHELHDLVLDVALGKDGLDDGQGHVMRAHAGARGALEVDGDDAGVGDIVGVLKQLLGQLAAALAHRHGAQGAVAGVGVGAQDHLAAPGEVLAHEGVDDGDVGRHEDAAVLLGRGEAEDVVVLVDGASDGAQGVVAVGEHVGQRELRHAGRARRLDDAHEGDVVARHGVKADLERLGISGGVVRLQDGPGDGAPTGLFGRGRDASGRGVGLADELLAAAQVDAALVQLDHGSPLSPGGPGHAENGCGEKCLSGHYAPRRLPWGYRTGRD